MAHGSEQGSGSASARARKIAAEVDSPESRVRGASNDPGNLTTVVRTSVEALRRIPDEAPGDGDTFVGRGIAEAGNDVEVFKNAAFLKKSFGRADLRTWATNPLLCALHAPWASSR